MKALIITLSLFLGSAAQAGGSWEYLFMSLGHAPFRGSVQGSLQLSNQGNTDITHISWDLRGPSFSAKDNCPKVLAPGKSCRIRVVYWNQFPGSVGARLIVKTSDKNYDVTISASGADDPFRNIPRPPIPGRP